MINFISKSSEFVQLLICKKSRGLFLFKRNEKRNRKGTLTPKMPFAARFSCCATIDFNSILKYFPRGYDDKFYIKIFGICPTCDRWKIVSTEILPNLLSITNMFFDLPTVSFPLFRTDKAFCFFHYLTPSLKADLNLKQALSCKSCNVKLLETSQNRLYFGYLGSCWKL